jgi:cell division protein FtsZ
LRSPLLDLDISDATSALVNVIGGPDMTISEAEGVVEEIYKSISSNSRIIWGAQIDPDLKSKIKTMIVITGVKSSQILGRERISNDFQKKYGIDFVE